MRDMLLERLGSVTHRRFLVYLMGPYKSFAYDDVVKLERTTDVPEKKDGNGNEDEGVYAEHDGLTLLQSVRDRLRNEAGLNAFLAIDADIPLDENDAASQSIAFANASNVIAFVAPAVGKNLGVGIEIGSVLEGLTVADQERVVFVHETDVHSAMIGSLSRRWDVTVYSYVDEDELVKQIREFAVDIMARELFGDLPPRPDS